MDDKETSFQAMSSISPSGVLSRFLTEESGEGKECHRIKPMASSLINKGKKKSTLPEQSHMQLEAKKPQRKLSWSKQ